MPIVFTDDDRIMFKISFADLGELLRVFAGELVAGGRRNVLFVSSCSSTLVSRKLSESVRIQPN